MGQYPSFERWNDEIGADPSNFKYGTQKNLLAKSKEYGAISLVDHLIETAVVANQIADMTHFSHNKEIIKRCAFIAGLFHDIGKAAAGFQEMIQNKKVKKWPEGVGGYRHEILSSALFLINMEPLRNWKNEKYEFNATYFAVLTHHKPYRLPDESSQPCIPRSQFYEKTDFKQMYKELLLNKTALKESWEIIIARISKFEWCKQLIHDKWLPEKLEIPSLDNILQKLKFRREVIPGYITGIVYKDLFFGKYSKQGTELLSFIRATLITGDHLASGGIFDLPKIPDFVKINVFLKNKKPRSFQKACGNHEGSLILRAPTGSGKTEAALLWIKRNQLATPSQLGKIFFVLPFTANINAMAKRMMEILNCEPGEFVGIQHGKASSAIYSLIEEEVHGRTQRKKEDAIKHSIYTSDEKFLQTFSQKKSILHFSEVKDITQLLNRKTDMNRKSSQKTAKHSEIAINIAQLAKEMYYPIKITTPHQLIKGFFQGKGWEGIVSEFYGGCFVFDEIHAYSPQLTGLIFGMANALVEHYHAKIMFMSATFPTLLKNLLRLKFSGKFQKFIELNPKEASDNKILTLKRHKLLLKDDTLISVINNKLFDKLITSNKRILVICNTVKTAQMVYESIKKHEKIENSRLLLFHSRFRQIDRRKIEKKVIDPKTNDIQVLVATQVIEVSLNIDFDHGIIESAPLDALVQRMGRINRVGSVIPLEANVWITKHEKISNYIYPEELSSKSYSLLSKIQGKLASEEQLIHLIDKLYPEEYGDEDLRKFENAFNAIQEFPANALPGSYLPWIEKVLDNSQTIEVLLESDLAKYRELKFSDPVKASEYLIEIRFRKKKHIDYSEKKFPPILKKEYYAYSELTGLNYPLS